MNIGFPIDWAATGSMLSGWATLGGAIAVVYAARVGSNTFDAWKRQKLEERRMDAAERILTLAYRLKYNLQSIRSPWMPGGEIETAEKSLDESQPQWRVTLSKNEQERVRLAQAYFNRLNRHSDDWQQIWELKPVALAFFGADAESELHEFWGHYIDISTAAEAYARPSGDEAFDIKTRKTLFGGDEKSQEIAASVKKLEVRLHPILREGAELASPS